MRFARPLVVAVCLLSSTGARTLTPAFTRVLPLDPGEGVFAYARISPDGRHLAYASERAAAPAP